MTEAETENISIKYKNETINRSVKKEEEKNDEK